MQEKYKNWIEDWLSKNDPRAKCLIATKEMKKSFDELIIVRGHYYEPIWDQEREHWWLKTTENEIIDPTALQFPTNGISTYTEWEEGKEEPCGNCMNCGNYVFSSNGFSNACSLSCNTILLKYYS